MCGLSVHVTSSRDGSHLPWVSATEGGLQIMPVFYESHLYSKKGLLCYNVQRLSQDC